MRRLVAVSSVLLIGAAPPTSAELVVIATDDPAGVPRAYARDPARQLGAWSGFAPPSALLYRPPSAPAYTTW